MLKRLHNQFGTAGLVLSVVAIVLALGGGAYAASGGLSGKQKKEVEKIAKKYAGNHSGATASKAKQGKSGPRGKTGPAGKALRWG